MKVVHHSYRYGAEILQHDHYSAAWDELMEVLKATPLFVYPGKSAKNAKLDVVQQAINVYFDRKLSIDRGWDWHPYATAIQNSGLRADFRKTFKAVPRASDIDQKTGEVLTFPDLTIQTEVQFGNAARWYSDIFKFQTAYAQGLTNIGICVLPMGSVARRIDSNIASYERALKELPSALMSITIPIVLFGIEPDDDDVPVNIRDCQFPKIGDITGKGNSENRWRIVHAHENGQAMNTVSAASDTGPMFDDDSDAEDVV